MKKINFGTMLAIAVMGVGFASCSSNDDLDGNNNGNLELKLAQMTEVKCYSESEKNVIGENETWYYKVQDYQYTGAEHRPAAYNLFADKAPAQGNGEAVTDAEKTFVMDYLKNHPNEGSTEFNHYNYFIQYVGGSYATYNMEFIQNGAVHHTQQITGSNHIDFIEFVDQNGKTKHINDYNAGYGPRALVLNLKITAAKFHDSYANLTYDNKYQFYVIKDVPQADGTTATGYYLCFDYATKKWDNGDGEIAGDGIYNDYVIKITPACGVIDPDQPDQPVDPDPVDPVNPDDPTEPDEPAVVVTNGHVEVNLSVKANTPDSKLSVHVRDTCDFKVFIPVPEQYYCNVDDMFIVEKHYENMSYNVEPTTMERTIVDNKVTLTVTYKPEGIYVESNGINAEVLEYLRNVYGDGLTFEVNNYFNTLITRNVLIAYLNQSTIEFKNGQPKEYINTIVEEYEDENGNIIQNVDAEGNKLDCVVTRK